MSEINLEELAKPKTTRPELEKVAADLGLTGADKYVNKPAVFEAIKKVHEGADAAEVSAEFTPVDDDNASTVTNDPATTPATPSVTENDEDDEDDADDAETQSDAPKTAKKRYAKNRNQGHPTAFDETGRPLYRA